MFTIVFLIFFQIDYLVAIENLGKITFQSDYVESAVIRNFRIGYYGEKIVSGFPSIIFIEFEELGLKLNIEFEKDSDIEYPDIYVIDDEKQLIKYEFETSQEYQHYKQIDGNSFSTLVYNNEQRKYKMLARLYLENDLDHFYEISPDSNTTYEHLIVKRKLMKNNEFKSRSIIFSKNSLEQKDYIILDNNEIKYSINRDKIKTAVNDKPVKTEVETLIVSDISIYRQFKRISNSDNTDKIFTYMKVYYGHLFNGINQKFQNSMSNDPDLRITIKLTKFLFLKKKDDARWADPDVVGDPLKPIHNSKKVILGNKTLNEFKKFMNTKKFPFRFDLAIGVFNKDLWLDDLRSNSSADLLGLSYNAGVCSDHKYSIAEDWGGFTSLYTIAHQIGHNLGVVNDEELAAINCSSNDLYIMTSNIKFYQMKNMQIFSNCSVALFKNTLLGLDGNLKKEFFCLSNINNSLPNEVRTADHHCTGQIWDSRNQCKMRLGNNASFCQNLASNMCSYLYCRSSLNNKCSAIAPAAEGTSCGSGKICISGICVTTQLAPESDCLFGDDVVSLGTYGIKTQATCSEFFKYLSQNKKSPTAYCLTEIGYRKCCISCQKYKLLKCVDTDINCPFYSTSCGKGLSLNGKSLDTVCSKTCGLCMPEQLNCKNASFLCQNGARCENIKTSPNRLFAFKCICSPSYYGELCEKKSMPNLWKILPKREAEKTTKRK